MDERNSDIGDGLVASTLYPLSILSRVEMGAAEGARLSAAWVFVAPLLEVAHAEVILVVEEKLMQAGTVHVDELQLHLCGSYSVYISFGEVLLTRAGGLNHLINCPVSNSKELMGKIEGNVIDAFCFFEGL